MVDRLRFTSARRLRSAIMAAYLSPEWLAEARRCGPATSEALRKATAGVALVVQQEVSGGPDGDTAYHVVVDHGAVSVVPGRSPTTPT